MLGDRWGVTDMEVARRYACDDFVVRPVLEAWRGATVDAPRAAVWSQLLQIRLAPYSYDWIDNLGRRSPVGPYELDDPSPGDAFTAMAGRPLGQVLAVEPRVHLTARILGAIMTYRLDPHGDAQTRLVLKIVAPGSRIAAQALCLGDLVMARRQLLNVKALAEARSDRHGSPKKLPNAHADA